MSVFRLEVYTEAISSSADLHPDCMAQLTSLEKELVKSQVMVTVRGKRGTPVPVLIPQDCRAAMDYLSNSDVRQTLGIDQAVDDRGNHFFFANKGEQYCFVE